jgi:hypothetical protein
MQRLLLTLGAVLLLAGLVWPWLTRLGLGHLPGDIRVERPHVRLYIPLGSMLLVSVAVSLFLTVLAWLGRR